MSSQEPFICIAEDNPDLQTILEATFTSSNLTVALDTDGQVALEHIIKDHPDLAILDINLPSLSGLDILQKVRQNPETAAMKVVMMSSNSQALSSPEVQLADLVLTKPIDIFELVTFVKRLLGISN